MWTRFAVYSADPGDHRCKVDDWAHSAIWLNATNPLYELISGGRKEIRD
ncbi:conserved hypothetical protein [Mycobacterium avium 104]|uniref:Uncharacterized protein n=1 Tax=Mycobacterium avium (strain 104) TaxID=243243 RepID=A0A0H2ZYA9_MYCA1|nr:conserved hypothetical protein [Mycobacterium avium 104]ETZ55474.1 hypothetical protein L839_0111 [Mycobacterium avium MAV_120809_2495]